MFFEKLRVPQRQKKKHTTAYYAAMCFTCVIEFALGTNAAFLMYQNFKVTIYSMLSIELWASILTIILAFAFGFGVFLGGLWTFAGFIDNIEDAKAYRKEYKSGHWPQGLIWAGLVLVVGLDFTTLLFRVAYFSEKGATSLFAFFCVLIVLPPVLGPLIHVLEHTPRVRREARIRNFAEQLDIDEQERAIRSMDPDLRAQVLSADSTVVADAWKQYYARIEQERNANYEYEQKQIAERSAGDARKNQGFAKDDRPLP